MSQTIAAAPPGPGDGHLPTPNLRPRVVVVDMISHQLPGEQPTGGECRYAQTLECEEEPYRRRVVVGEEWTPLDLGWFADRPERVGFVVIDNRGSGAVRNTVPTPEEEARERARELIVGLEVGGVPGHLHVDRVPRGDARRLMPIFPDRFRLRAPHGPCVVHLSIYPR